MTTVVQVLGAIRVSDPSTSQDVPGLRQRALLAALAVSAGRTVSVSELVDAVWEDEPPARARSTLQTYVSRLRGAYGPIIEHGPGGYRLAPAVAVDVADVRATLARLERGAPPPDDRAALALAALDRWEGPALADLRDRLWFAGAVGELDELHARLVDIAAEALIASGQASAAVGLIEHRSHVTVAREPTQVLLVRALHAGGRSTEALRAADRYRTWLREETGLLPGPAFLEAERAALEGEPVEEQPSSPAPAAGGATLARPTPLIGRSGDLDRLGAELASNRLVTVTGTGGVGKTRLVAELVAGDGAERWIVAELAPVEPGAVASVLGAALGYRADVADERVLAELLRSEAAVLVLDNCEHVVTEVRRLVRHLLDTCPSLRVLATSRTRLDLADERVVSLAPLAADAPGAPAVELFVDRLRRTHPDFDPTAHAAVLREVCTRLDGVPLALELAASRAAALGLRALADRLDAPMELLVTSTDRGGRHADLAGVIAWSVELLDPAAQQVLAAASAFHGSFDVDAAERVASPVVDEPVAPILGRLVDASLVAATDRPGRFRLLEMIRVDAARRLDPAPWRDRVHGAHAAWVAGELRSIAARSAGPEEAATSRRLDELRAEVEAALAWAEQAGDVQALAALAEPLATPLLYRPEPRLVVAVLAVASGTAAASTPAPGLLAAGARSAFLLGDLTQVERLAHQAVELAGRHPAARHRAAHALGVVRLYQGRFEESRRWFERVTVDDEASVVARLDALGGLGLALCYLQHHDEAVEALAQLRALAEVNDSDTYRAFGHYLRGELALAEGDIDGATACLAQAGELAWSVGATFVWGIASTVLASILVHHRPVDEARHHLPVLIERWRRTATWPQLWTTLRLVAELLHATGRAEVALLVLEAAERDSGSPTPVGADAERIALLRSDLEAGLGSAAVAGIAAAAAAMDRVAVLERAVDALAR